MTTDAPTQVPTSERTTGSDLPRVLVVLVLAVAQVASAALTAPLLGDDAQTGNVSDSNANVLTPSGYAFSIWGVIYLLCLAYAARQLLPSQRARPIHRATGWWVAGAFLMSTVWVPLFGRDQLVLSQVVIFTLVGLLAVALARIASSPDLSSAADGWLLAFPVSLYLGWASLASVAGAATTGVFLGAPDEGGVAVVFGVGALLVATLVVAGVLRWLPRHGLGFAVAATWALVAVAVGTPSSVITWVALGCAAAIAVAGVRHVMRSGRPDARTA